MNSKQLIARIIYITSILFCLSACKKSPTGPEGSQGIQGIWGQQTLMLYQHSGLTAQRADFTLPMDILPMEVN